MCILFRCISACADFLGLLDWLVGLFAFVFVYAYACFIVLVYAVSKLLVNSVGIVFVVLLEFAAFSVVVVLLGAWCFIWWLV